MRSLRPKFQTFAVAVFSILLCASLAHAKKPTEPPGGGGGGAGGDPTYTIQTFLPPGTEDSPGSYVHHINGQDQAVGYILTENREGFIGYQLEIDSGVYTQLADGLGPISINNLGQIVGAEVDESGFETAIFLASASASPSFLPPLAGDTFTNVEQINDDGVAVGHSVFVVDSEIQLWRPVAWRVQEKEDSTIDIKGPIELPEFYEGGESYVYDLNETLGSSAQVIGESVAETYPPAMAVIWTLTVQDDGSLTASAPMPLGTLDLDNPSVSSGRAINNLGDAAGQSDRRAFLAPAGQSPQQLPVLNRILHSTVSDLNDGGACVGETKVDSRGFSTADVATLWKNGEVIDLNELLPKDSGWDRLHWATTINNAGVIGGFGEFNGQRRGFLMIPSEEGSED